MTTQTPIRQKADRKVAVERTPSDGPLIDFSDVAAEPPAVSIARENHIVERIARSATSEAAERDILEQLEALFDADELSNW